MDDKEIIQMLKHHDLPSNAPQGSTTKKPSRIIVYLKTGDIIIGNPRFQHKEKTWVYSYGGAPNSSYSLASIGACHIPASDIAAWDYIDEPRVEFDHVEIKRTFKLVRNPNYADGSVVCISLGDVDIGVWSFEVGLTFIDQKFKLLFTKEELNHVLVACARFVTEEMKSSNV